MLIFKSHGRFTAYQYGTTYNGGTVYFYLNTVNLSEAKHTLCQIVAHFSKRMSAADPKPSSQVHLCLQSSFILLIQHSDEPTNSKLLKNRWIPFSMQSMRFQKKSDIMHDSNAPFTMFLCIYTFIKALSRLISANGQSCFHSTHNVVFYYINSLERNVLFGMNPCEQDFQKAHQELMFLDLSFYSLENLRLH